MAKHTFNKSYDIDAIYNYTNTPDEISSLLEDRHIIKYRTKTIKSGNVLECEVYPVWDTRASLSRARKTRESRESQKTLNKKNALKNLIRLINTNFTDKDIWGTFTYDEQHLPATEEFAKKEMSKFARRLKYYAEKHNFPPLKYIYVTEYEDDEKKGKKRVHHHIVTNFPDRDVAESLWRNGARTQTRRLQADESGYEGMTRYILKDPRGIKSYVTSKNLQKPQITIADYKITRKKVNQIARGDISARSTLERIYQGYEYIKHECRFSEYVSGAYMYAKLTKTDAGGVKNEIYRQQGKARRGNSRNFTRVHKHKRD